MYSPLISVVLLHEGQSFLLLFLHILEDGESQRPCFSLLLLCEFLIFQLGPLNLLQPIIVSPHCILVIGLHIHRLGLSHSDGALQKLSLVVIVNSSHGVFALVELHEGVPAHLFRDVVNGYLYVLDVTEWGEEGLDHLLCDCFGKVSHVYGPSVIVLVYHSLLNIINNKQNKHSIEQGNRECSNHQIMQRQNRFIKRCKSQLWKTV